MDAPSDEELCGQCAARMFGMIQRDRRLDREQMEREITGREDDSEDLMEIIGGDDQDD